VYITGFAVFGATARTLVAKTTAAGALDNSFNGDGLSVVDTTGGAGRTEQSDAVVLPDDRLVLVGARAGASDNAFAMRLTTNGDLDPTFGGGDGWVEYDSAGADTDAFHAVTRAIDGSFFVGGIATGTGAIVMHVSSDGVLDTNFGTAGVTAVPGMAQIMRMQTSFDGRPAFVGMQNATNDVMVGRLDSTAVPQYNDIANDDWTTAARSGFGVCLKSVGGSAAAVWTVNATCPMTDGLYWNDVLTATEKVANITTTGLAGSATFRFGFRPLQTQSPATYYAPVTFEVLAPDA
jgi:hypothetical protein